MPLYACVRRCNIASVLHLISRIVRVGLPQLTVLMAQLALACKATSRACAKAGIANLFGMAGDQNSSGDDQKKLDVLSNDIFINALVKSGSCAVLVSEENDEPIIVPEELAGRFCVAFDPLDGSSNIDCNVRARARQPPKTSAPHAAARCLAAFLGAWRSALAMR